MQSCRSHVNSEYQLMVAREPTGWETGDRPIIATSMSFQGWGLRWGNSTLSTAIVLGDWAWKRLQRTFLRLARVSLKLGDWLGGKLQEVTPEILLVFYMNAWTLPDSALPPCQQKWHKVTFLIERFVVQCSKMFQVHPSVKQGPKLHPWHGHRGYDVVQMNPAAAIACQRFRWSLSTFRYWNHDKRGLWLYDYTAMSQYSHTS